LAHERERPPRKRVEGKTTACIFEEEESGRPRPSKRRVGRLRVSRSRKSVTVWIMEQFAGVVFMSDLQELFKGGRDIVPIYVFEDRK